MNKQRKTQAIRRWVIFIADGISTILFLAVAALLITSWIVGNEVGTRQTIPAGPGRLRTRYCTVQISRGNICIKLETSDYDIPPAEHWMVREVRPEWIWSSQRPAKPVDVIRIWPGDTYTNHFTGFGFGYESTATGLPAPQRWVGRTDLFTLPIWSLLVINAPLLLHTLWRSRLRYRRRRRIASGLCANCGYDMRASPDRCSECGQ